MKAVQAAFPKLKILMVESIPIRPTQRAPSAQFVSQGANMVFATSNYGDFLYDVADVSRRRRLLRMRRPNPLDNLSWYYVQHWYPTYVTGVAAGLISKTGKLGYVGSFPRAVGLLRHQRLPDGGAHASTPTRPCRSSASIPGSTRRRATQAGTALIDNGCDFLFGIMDEAGYLQVAEKRGVKAVMWNTDMRRYGPKAYVSSIIVDLGGLLRRAGRQPARRNVDAAAARSCRWAAASTATNGARPCPRTVQQAGRRRARQDPGRLRALRRRDQGQQGRRARSPTARAMTSMELYNWDWSVEGVDRPLRDRTARPGAQTAIAETAPTRRPPDAPSPGTPPVVLLHGHHKVFSRRRRQCRTSISRSGHGEIHALLGENGAGKSTLMNILTGIYQPDAGEIIIDGYAKTFASPVEAIAAGIGMVHQHFKLVKAFTVAENIHLGWSETPRLRSAARAGSAHARLCRQALQS